jgi:SAM-dependent methyltransferase
MTAISVEAGYDRWASTYDDGANLTRDAASAKVRIWAPMFAEKDVLELGCGTGRNTAMLATLARTVDAVDFSDGMLAQAARRPECAGVRFVRQDITQRLTLDSETYDLVIESLVLEHVRDLVAVFEEVFRLLRSGGEFLGSELHPYRQRLGKQARFRPPGQDEEIPIAAYAHSIAEFVNCAIGVGFHVAHLAEDEDASGELRLLSFRLKKP